MHLIFFSRSIGMTKMSVITLDSISVSKHLSLPPSPEIPLLKAWFPWGFGGGRGVERVEIGSVIYPGDF